MPEGSDPSAFNLSTVSSWCWTFSRISCQFPFTQKEESEFLWTNSSVNWRLAFSSLDGLGIRGCASVMFQKRDYFMPFLLTWDSFPACLYLLYRCFQPVPLGQLRLPTDSHFRCRGKVATERWFRRRENPKCRLALSPLPPHFSQ